MNPAIEMVARKHGFRRTHLSKVRARYVHKAETITAWQNRWEYVDAGWMFPRRAYGQDANALDRLLGGLRPIPAPRTQEEAQP
jgi:hypothetical protein